MSIRKVITYVVRNRSDFGLMPGFCIFGVRDPEVSVETRGMPDHRLKIRPEFYDAVASGKKNFELRRDDREPKYAAGQVIDLLRYSHDPSEPNPKGPCSTCAMPGVPHQPGCRYAPAVPVDSSLEEALELADEAKRERRPWVVVGHCDIVGVLALAYRQALARIREFDKSIDAEQRDPNGTIWEVAAQFQKERDEARAALEKHKGFIEDWRQTTRVLMEERDGARARVEKMKAVVEAAKEVGAADNRRDCALGVYIIRMEEALAALDQGEPR